MNEMEEKLVYILYECQQHKKMIAASFLKIEESLPLSVKNYQSFEVDTIGYIDQFLFRFSKLQDTMGEKLFSLVLLLLKEDFSSKPFIDILNRLEKLRLLDKNEWMKLRKIRNNVAHEYSYNVEELVDSLNDIYSVKTNLINIYDTFYDYCNDKFKFVSDSSILKAKK